MDWFSGSFGGIFLLLISLCRMLHVLQVAHLCRMFMQHFVHCSGDPHGFINLRKLTKTKGNFIPT